MEKRSPILEKKNKHPKKVNPIVQITFWLFLDQKLRVLRPRLWRFQMSSILPWAKAHSGSWKAVLGRIFRDWTLFRAENARLLDEVDSINLSHAVQLHDYRPDHEVEIVERNSRTPAVNVVNSNLKLVLRSMTNCQRRAHALKKFFRRAIGARGSRPWVSEPLWITISAEHGGWILRTLLLKRRKLPDGKAMKWQTHECKLLIHHDIEIHHVGVFDVFGAADWMRRSREDVRSPNWMGHWIAEKVPSPSMIIHSLPSSAFQCFSGGSSRVKRRRVILIVFIHSQLTWAEVPRGYLSSNADKVSHKFQRGLTPPSKTSDRNSQKPQWVHQKVELFPKSHYRFLNIWVIYRSFYMFIKRWADL
jgi:hypothetical protein